MRTFRPSRLLQSGFTLIELVVVVAILVVLSGMVLPKLDVFKLKANKGVAAANMAGVDRYIESFRVQRDVYPDHFDSLIANGATTLFPELEPQCIGNGPVGTPNKLTTTTIATGTNELRSINRMGITTVLDHVTGGFPSNSAQVPRVLADGDTLATINAADPDGQGILNSIYPATSGVVPPGSKVIVFGVGPQSDMIGYTLHAAPFYANADQTKYYTRMLALFEMHDDGSRARFLTSIGADGDILGDEVADYYTE